VDGRAPVGEVFQDGQHAGIIQRAAGDVRPDLKAGQTKLVQATVGLGDRPPRAAEAQSGPAGEPAGMGGGDGS
jgi:hypothetical protein